MFDGTDEDGRPYGVYLHNIQSKVFEYEIYGLKRIFLYSFDAVD